MRSLLACLWCFHAWALAPSQPSTWRIPSIDEPLIDVRQPEDFARCHVVGATSIPIEQLEQRVFELPAPFEAPLALCASTDADLVLASEILQARGWSLKGRHRVADAQNLETVDVPTASGSASTPCWRPSAFLATMMQRLVDENLLLLPAGEAGGRDVTNDAQSANGGKDGVSGMSPDIGPLAFDLGCGSGRDCVFMASKLPEHWRVVGFDNHGHALERGAALAELMGVEQRVAWAKENLRKPEALRRWCETQAFLPSRHPSIVHGCRFLDRRLICEVRDHVLAPGGIFLWSTFMEGEENLAPPFRPSRRLFPGELKYLFTGDSKRKFDILVDEEGSLITRNTEVPAQFFAARLQP